MEQVKREEYEVIRHNTANFHVFLVNLLYRTPHAHKDFEIGLILDGEVDIISANRKEHLVRDDIFLINPYQPHELISSSPALILSIQVPPGFFSYFYPKISFVTFQPIRIGKDSVTNNPVIRSNILDIAKAYFTREEFFEFKCATLINQLFYFFLKNVEIMVQTEQEQKTNHLKGTRARKIIHYIDEHYTERIMLGDIAKQENLDLYYLSHFFKESFGVSFQTYVNRLRCEKARTLLLTTDHSLLDVCIESGFSDPKYFNKGFKELYGCLPKQYRKNFQNLDLPMQQKSMLSTQEFLSIEASIVTLKI